MLRFPSMMIRVGSRKSDLAQIQSRIVAGELKKVQPDLNFEYVFKDVGVDLNLNISLVDAETRGLFTKDLSLDLIAGKIDMVVHSWKDLPTTGPAETVVAATLTREDPRDVLFVKKSSFERPSLQILCSSPRREHNLGGFLKRTVFPQNELLFVPIRGNLPTRMRKFLAAEESDGLVLALAAVNRLMEYGNEESKSALADLMAASEVAVIPVLENPPAPAQGALAIEVRRDRKDILDLLAKINHEQSYRDVMVERDRLKDFGGGCHLALGIYQRTTARGTLRIERGKSPDGAELADQQWIGAKSRPVVAPEKFFDASALNLFERKDIEVAPIPAQSLVVVAKSQALPKSFVQSSQILWAAGLETWRKLRARGFWVSGSFEGLGEKFFEIPQLWPAREQIKLTHKSAVTETSDVATYELEPRADGVPDLSKYEAFYWPSGSAFLRCLKADPNIRGKLHLCGLGNTYTEIAKHISEDRLFSVLDREDCLRRS